MQVSTSDTAGGAQKIAMNLFHAFRESGQISWLVVGHKKSDNLNIFLHKDLTTYKRNMWMLFWNYCASIVDKFPSGIRGFKLIRDIFQLIGGDDRPIKTRLGIELFNYSYNKDLLLIPPESPDIIVCHNLHGSYFDLRTLVKISKTKPVVLTLHDAWLLSGHCAHSIDCDKWMTGCGLCPDLSIYPSIRRDSTSYNWKQKRKIFEKIRIYVSTPSLWLLEKVKKSILASAIIEARVIPNGVDTSIFYAVDNKQKIRDQLGIRKNTRVVLFTAYGIRNNPWKDFKTMQRAVEEVAISLKGENLLFIALGEDSPNKNIGKATIQFVPYQMDPAKVALYYQAVDIYIHAARADTFPTTVLEALACGTPVVGTAVGGVPEQIQDGITGFLVPCGDSRSLADRIHKLLVDDNLRIIMGRNAAEYVKKHYSLLGQVNTTVDWYKKIVNTFY